MKSKIVPIFIIVFGLVLVVSLSRSLWRMRRSQSRLIDLKQTVQAERERKNELEKIVTWRKSREFVEQEARNRLQMVKEGEKIVVLPRENAAGNNMDINGDVLSLNPNQGNEETAVWKQWMALFGLN